MATAERTEPRAERIEPRAQHEVRALLTRVGDTLTPAELERLCQRIYIRGELWRPLLNLGEDHVCEVLYLDTCVGVYLISWSPGDDTGLHDHAGSSGGVVVAQGTIHEERPGRENADELIDRRAGSSFHFGDSEPHRIENASDLVAATIHCSSPPLDIADMCPRADSAVESLA